MPEQWEDEDVPFVHLWLTPEGLKTYHYEIAGFGLSVPQRVLCAASGLLARLARHRVFAKRRDSPCVEVLE
jgi:hypothetical protein